MSSQALPFAHCCSAKKENEKSDDDAEQTADVADAESFLAGLKELAGQMDLGDVKVHVVDSENFDDESVALA